MKRIGIIALLFLFPFLERANTRILAHDQLAVKGKDNRGKVVKTTMNKSGTK